MSFWDFFFKHFGGGKLTPPIPTQPVTKLVATTVAGGAVGILQPDSGPAFTSTATSGGRLEFIIPWTLTGGANLTLTLNGYETLIQRVILQPELDAVIPMVLAESRKPLPPIPTREQVCSIKMSLQGMTYHTQKYGDMPGVFFWSSYEDRKTSVFPAHRAAGDTHMVVGISGSYNEPSTIWPPEITKGGDNSKNLRAFKDQIREVIDEGFFVDIALSGDGQSKGDATGYNDPVGSTYGYQWLMNNLPRIIKAVRGDADSECPDGIDLTPYCVWRPGWDGCFVFLAAVFFWSYFT